MTRYENLCETIRETQIVLDSFSEFLDTGMYEDAKAIVDHLTAAKLLIEKINESNEPY